LNVPNCWRSGTDGFGGTFSIKKVTPTIETNVNTEINTNGARQPKAFPNTRPIGTPKTIEPLIPMETTPIARPRYAGSTIPGAMTRQRTTNNDPLNAVIIRPKNKIEKVELNIVTRLLKKNRNKKIKVRRFRSMLAVATNKIGPATAKISEKMEIKSPACPKLI